MNDSNDNGQKINYGILFENFGGFIQADEFDFLRNDLVQYEISVEEIEKRGIYNNIEEITNFITVYMSSPLILGLIGGIVPNAAWDLIKITIYKAFIKLRGLKFTKHTSRGTEEKSVTFGVELMINKNEKYNFKFESITSDETMLVALDKILEFSDKQKKNDKLNNYNEYLVIFDDEIEEWKKINILEYIQKNIIEKKNRE